MNLPTETGPDAAIALELQRMPPIEALVGPERFPRLYALSGGATLLGLSATGLLAVALPFPVIPGFHRAVVAVIFALTGLLGAAILLAPAVFPPKVIRLLVVLTGPAYALLFHFLGPEIEMGVAPLVFLGVVCTFAMTRRWVVATVGLMACAYAVTDATAPGYPGAASRVAVVVGTLVVGTLFCSWVTIQARNVAIKERTTHRALEDAHRQLADLNQNLEERVAAQVAEIGALSGLRRFLSPQVAEALLTAGDESILQPHRRQIAVFFCDLRGFTTFTGGAEPEEVVEALDAYYKIVGDVLRRHDATVGTFAGDGIMAYLNDPVPCDDPAGTAVTMAIELREPMAAFVDTWKRRGHDLGYGVGITYGYATLGSIGFEGRYDYTALGSVVNLAARLCGEAASGEVLVDARTSDALGLRFETLAREVTVRGFASPVTAFRVAG
ncbi:MAG: adenylate/guanylate cyclase domain-containing protein [Acidimicrobiales bacterium]